MKYLLLLLVVTGCKDEIKWGTPYHKCLKESTYTYMVAVHMGKVVSMQPRVGTRCDEESVELYIDKGEETFMLVEVGA